MTFTVPFNGGYHHSGACAGADRRSCDWVFKTPFTICDLLPSRAISEAIYVLEYLGSFKPRPNREFGNVLRNLALVFSDEFDPILSREPTPPDLPRRMVDDLAVAELVVLDVIVQPRIVNAVNVIVGVECTLLRPRLVPVPFDHQ